LSVNTVVSKTDVMWIKVVEIEQSILIIKTLMQRVIQPTMHAWWRLR